MLAFICPLCRNPLAAEPKTWRCPQGHSFDVAREGYVNLLPVQHKRSLAPGDNAGMVLARREFLDAGHYAPLRDAVAAVAASFGARTVLDIGCGEGYYTRALSTDAAEIAGLDIAKPAVRLAARRSRGIRWIVGSSAQLPFADASLDLVTSLFSPLPLEEMLRVLAVDGQVLIVTPAADHLWGIRERLFDEVQPHVPDKFLAGFESRFELCRRERVRFPLGLEKGDLVRLLQMTPYAWRAKPERRAEVEGMDGILVDAAFEVMVFRKRDVN